MYEYLTLSNQSDRNCTTTVAGLGLSGRYYRISRYEISSLSP